MVFAIAFLAAAPCVTADAVYGRVLGVGGASVVLEGAGRRLELVTRDDGSFLFPGLPAGEYRVSVEKPGYAAVSGQVARLAAGSCAELSIAMQPDRRIRGRVFDPDGRPASGIPVTLLDAAKIPTRAQAAARTSVVAPLHSPTVGTNAEGRFEFKNLEPGDYYLGINLDRPVSTLFPYGRVYYPGTQDQEFAGAIHLAEGKAEIVADLTLPPKQAERIITGVVVWPDGRPAVGATIYLEESQFPWRTLVPQATVDEQGLFSVNCFDQTRYVLHAASACKEISDCRSAAPYEIGPGVQPSLRLVLATPGHSALDAYKKAFAPESR